MKTCSVCKEVKSLKEFGRYSKSKSGIHYRCKKCNNECTRRICKGLYNSWRGAKERCNNPNHKNYSLYKNRWCSLWDKFEDFKEWALRNGYKKGLTIDRINSTLGYSPENCQWITARENTIKGNKERSLYAIC